MKADALISLLTATLALVSLFAVPRVDAADRELRRVPTRLVIDKDGNTTVEERPRLENEPLPERIPVTTMWRDGRVLDGIAYEVATEGSFAPSAEVPYAICFNFAEQRFVVRKQVAFVVITHVTLPEGYVGIREGSRWVAFRPECSEVPTAEEALQESIRNRLRAFRPRASWNIEYSYSVQDIEQAFGASVRQEIEGAIARCDLRLQSLLGASYGTHTHTVTFASSLPGNPAGVAAITTPTVQGLSVNFYRASVAVNNQFNGEPDVESDAWLDVPSPIPFRRTVGGTPTAAQLGVASALSQSVQGVPSSPAATATTTFFNRTALRTLGFQSK